MNKVHYSSNSTEWETPQYLFDYFNKSLFNFNFTLDVCATPNNTKCKKFFTKKDNGLNQDWGNETCWMNPPYGKEIRHWVKKAYESSESGATVVCLLPSRTDTTWWHDYCMKAEIILIKGRINFLKRYIEKSGEAFLMNTSAPFPSAIVIFEPNYGFKKYIPIISSQNIKTIKEKYYGEN